LEVVCRDIYGHLNIPVPPIPPPPNAPPPPYIEGFLIFGVFYQVLPANPPVDPLDVEGIYTYRAELLVRMPCQLTWCRFQLRGIGTRSCL